MNLAEIAKVKRELYLARAKRTIDYRGGDPELQFLALRTLATVLGYRVDGFHEKIIRHQNTTAFGSRDADLTLGFRGGGKSTIGTIVRCIKYFLDDPNIRILLVSDTQGAAERFLREVKNHLRYNEDLIAMYGNFLASERGKDIGRARDSYLTTLQRTNRGISEPTLSAIGTGGQAASMHFEVIFLDDVVTIRNSQSQAQRKKISDWHGSTLIGCSIDTTVLHYLGTRYYPHDLYQDLEIGRVDETDGQLRNDTLKIPAVIIGPDGKEASNYPERYTLEKFKAMERRMGRYHFASQMQQDTSAGEGLVFKYSDLRWCAWYEDDWTEGTILRPPLKDLAIFQFSDLTAKRTDTGAFFVCTTIGVTQEKEGGKRQVFLLDMDRDRCGMEEQRRRILSAIAKWNPVQHGIEAVAMQAGFAEEVGERYDRRAVPIQVEADKVFRARRVAPIFEANRVFFPYPDTPEGRKFAVMIDELCSFPESEYMDCVDSVVGAITLAMYGGAPAGGATLDDDDRPADGMTLRGSY